MQLLRRLLESLVEGVVAHQEEVQHLGSIWNRDMAVSIVFVGVRTMSTLLFLKVLSLGCRFGDDAASLDSGCRVCLDEVSVWKLDMSYCQYLWSPVLKVI